MTLLSFSPAFLSLSSYRIWISSMNAFPAESQQSLLLEHGLHSFFMAQWVSIEDIGEVARRLRIAAETTVVCDFQAAMEFYGSKSGGSQRAWITRLAPGWSLVLYLNGFRSSPEALSLGGQRVFDVSCIYGIGEIDELSYIHDGVWDGTIYDEEEYRVHWEDLTCDISSLEGQLEEYLCVLGRVSGRFLDRDLFSSQGLLGVISE
ncbi:hypothetical protein [Herbidospora sp. NBRC 101105]|uniref:hypothetical protein n=1 Tax=Herbidospora sp. NBRC 101105 TaxID=3032195 RepID=UPI0025569E8F|nr:hypothetical protein [Herbidospora sp. NBRC 101105]